VNAVGAKDPATLFEMSPEQFDHVLDVNLRGYFNFLRAAATVFREQNGGKVVNVASLQATQGSSALNDVAAKMGVIGLTLAAARELGPYDVNVNAVAPGMVETAALKGTPAEDVEKAISRSVLGRLAKPEEVADVVIFLCSTCRPSRPLPQPRILGRESPSPPHIQPRRRAPLLTPLCIFSCQNPAGSCTRFPVQASRVPRKVSFRVREVGTDA
jgi:NAD(P)-dependent dehydrogenase (short-subunit alcohol dehydrogenase family)